MEDEELRDYVLELASRAEMDMMLESIWRPILDACFEQQRAFVTDRSKLKALFCTRRSAKSFTAGVHMLVDAIRNPGCNILFIGLTRQSAKDIIWKDILHVLDEKFGIGARFNKSELTMTLPNGSIISVTGVDVDEDEMRKLLGRKYRLVCIDEASMYTIDLYNLVYGVLGPAMTDPNRGGERGTIALLGTASDFPRGLFYDITTGKEPGWRLYQWTAYDNPHVAAQWAETMEDIRVNRPLYMETSQYKQWYLNHWVVDEELLCYGYTPAKNLQALLPNLMPDGWVRVLGVDTGWEDDNAFVLTQYHSNDPNLYIPWSFSQKRMTFDAVAEKILWIMKTYEPHKIFIDGANKQGVESMRLRTNIPFEYADKLDKTTFIELCKGDFVQGKIKIIDNAENRGLTNELSTLTWATDGGRIKIPKKENPAVPNHRADALLYAWRNGYHYHWTPLEPKIVKYSKAWYESQSEGLWEKEREKMLKESEESDWPSMQNEW